jgi:regulator of RNase E activity RraB
VTLPEVDPRRLEEEWTADQDVLANLAANGDKPEIVRTVDISFRGDDEALADLAGQAEAFGLSVLEREETEDGETFLFLACEQGTDEASIRALTLKCLQIEIIFDVEYDGWGCTAETGLIH